MTEPLPDYKRRALQQRREDLLAEYRVASEQLTRTLDAVNQTKIERQIADLDEKIQEIERALGPVPTQTDQSAERSVPAAAPPSEKPPASPESGRGGWFSRLPDVGKAALITGLFAVIVALIALVPNLVRPGIGPDPTSTPMSYVVRVVTQNATGTGVKNARVTLELPGRTPLDALTDNSGVANLLVPTQYVGGPAVMIVEAAGFTSFRQNVTVDTGMLPPLVQLAPQPPP